MATARHIFRGSKRTNHQPGRLPAPNKGRRAMYFKIKDITRFIERHGLFYGMTAFEIMGVSGCRFGFACAVQSVLTYETED